MKTSITAAETTLASTTPAQPQRRSKTKRATQQVLVTAPPARPGTKGARIVALLQKPSGASLKTLLKVTGWQAHSVRAFLSAYVSKRLGLPVTSFQKEGQRVYAIQR